MRDTKDGQSLSDTSNRESLANHLDPFVGTGTTCAVAKQLKRKSVGIDLSQEYLDVAKSRCDKFVY